MKDGNDGKEMVEKDIEVDEDNIYVTSLMRDLGRLKPEYFTDQNGDAYVMFNYQGKCRPMMVRGEAFSDYLEHSCWTCSGKPIGETVKKSVTNIVEAKAKFEGGKRTLHTRTAWDGDVLWYDLGNGKAVKVDENGWKIESPTDVLFRTFKHQKDQVEPVEGGDIDLIFKYITVNVRDWFKKVLFSTWITTVFFETIVRPIVIFYGQEGSAKTTASKLLKALIDPSSLEAITYPSNQKEFIQLLDHHYLVAFDNLSSLKESQSDDLCRVCTGQSFMKRELYSNDNDIVYNFKRAIVLNGINLVATKPDLLDRSLLFELDPITDENRISEEVLFPNFEKDKPLILGAIFTFISKAIKLKKEGKIELKSKPRLADFATWGTAVHVAMGGKADDFLKAYKSNIELQVEEALDGSALCQTIQAHMEGVDMIDEETRDLYRQLAKKAEELGVENDPEFPKSEKTLVKKMRPYKATLQKLGIGFKYLNKERPRRVVITNKNAMNDDGAPEAVSSADAETILKEKLTEATSTEATVDNVRSEAEEEIYYEVEEDPIDLDNSDTYDTY